MIRPKGPAPSGELAGLRARLAVAEETLRAIRSGEVDSVMVAGKEGSQVFTLDGAEHAYRQLCSAWRKLEDGANGYRAETGWGVGLRPPMQQPANASGGTAGPGLMRAVRLGA